MSTRPFRIGFFLLLCSCSHGEGPSGDKGQAPKHGAVVARVGAIELYDDDLKRAMARDPGSPPERFDDPAARRELLEGLIRFELLAQAADRAGFTKDPDAIHALQQIAVTKLVNQTLGAVASPESISQADVERDYRARQATEFTLPPAAQVRHIRVSDAELAERLAVRARALAPGDDRGFAALASSTSQDSATRESGGDLGFIDASSPQPRALVEAALRLQTPGEIVGPIATDSGYEILRLVTLRAAAVSPLSGVEQPIRQRLYRERRRQALDALIAKLRAETAVEVGEQARSPATRGGE